MIGALAHLGHFDRHPAQIPVEDPLAVEIERCHPDKSEPHGDQRQEEQRHHDPVQQHYAGPAAGKQAQGDQDGLHRRQAALQHQRHGKHQPHADQGRRNEGQHYRQTQQFEQRAKQAGDEAAEQAQAAKA